MSKDRVTDESIQQARDAVDRHAWREAYDLLATADKRSALQAEELELLAESASLSGHWDDCIEAWERVYASGAESSDNQRTARAAIRLFFSHYGKQATAVAMGWLHRATRILEDQPESPEHGYLSWISTNVAVGAGDLDAALGHAERTLEIGTRLNDLDLQAIGLFDQGNVLVTKGRVEEGMALLDEAMVAVVSGELGPFMTGTIYCSMITTCERLADYRRAGEWTDAAEKWCGRQAIAGFPGLCRVHRAEIMRLRGAWAKAEEEALLASDELRTFDFEVAGEALYEVGEIRLRMGDLVSAEEAFRQGHELGREPQPGLSLLRLAEGNVDAAATMIKGALAPNSLDRLARARLLPAAVEIVLAAGDVETARTAAEELAEIAEVYGTAAFKADAACARGSVELAEGDPTAACESLRNSWRLWQEVDAPYEAARARVLLGQAHRAGGDEESAALEFHAASSAFNRLGAALDARQSAELLSTVANTAGADATQRATRTFMFTDICKSTNLVEAIGDDAWEDLLRWHDQTLRALFVEHSGEEVKHQGDGFFVAFSDASAAVECAVAIQRTLADHRRAQGFSPQVRIGLHGAEATRRRRDYGGKGVHQAARIGALAEAGEILCSQETLAAFTDAIPVSEPRVVSLKGISEPVAVLSIDWR